MTPAEIVAQVHGLESGAEWPDAGCDIYTAAATRGTFSTVAGAGPDVVRAALADHLRLWGYGPAREPWPARDPDAKPGLDVRPAPRTLRAVRDIRGSQGDPRIIRRGELLHLQPPAVMSAAYRSAGGVLLSAFRAAGMIFVGDLVAVADAPHAAEDAA